MKLSTLIANLEAMANDFAGQDPEVQVLVWDNPRNGPEGNYPYEISGFEYGVTTDGLSTSIGLSTTIIPGDPR